MTLTYRHSVINYTHWYSNTFSATPFFVKQIKIFTFVQWWPKVGYISRKYSYNLNYCKVNLKSCQKEESYRTNKNTKSIDLNASRFFSEVQYHFVIAFAFTKSWNERKHDQKYYKLFKITCKNKFFVDYLYPCICIHQLTHPWHLSDPVLHQT